MTSCPGCDVTGAVAMAPRAAASCVCSKLWAGRAPVVPRAGAGAAAMLWSGGAGGC